MIQRNSNIIYVTLITMNNIDLIEQLINTLTVIQEEFVKIQDNHDTIVNEKLWKFKTDL